MTDLEVLQRARMYMELLAQGIDPVSGSPMSGGGFADPVRMGRCFSYVSGVLGKVIENGGYVGQWVRNKEFYLTPEQRASVPISVEPVRMRDFIETLYQAAGDREMKKISAVRISDWLVAQELLVKEMGPDGKMRRVPTERGRHVGLMVRERDGRDGPYQAVYYDSNAQRFLLDHLYEYLRKDDERG